MIRSIEREAIREDEADVLYELFSSVVTGLHGISVELAGVGGHQLALDGSEVHTTLDHVGVVRDAERKGINRIDEGSRILQPLESPNSRQTEAMLARRKSDWTSVLLDWLTVCRWRGN